MSPYVDFAEYYAFDHTITVDVEFYLDFAHCCQSPILELACGTGRLILPLAKAGFEVYGLDVSENMLRVCQQTLEQQGFEQKVQLSLADMANFDLPRKDFRLVLIALRSFMHLLTRKAQLACLKDAYRHIQPGGTLIISVIAPDPDRLAQQPSETFVVRREFELPNGHHVVRSERLVEHNPKSQVRHFEFKFKETDRDGKLVRERIVPLSTRYSFRDELQHLLENTGFQVVNVFRDYHQNPYDGTGEMIMVAQRPQ